MPECIGMEMLFSLQILLEIVKKEGELSILRHKGILNKHLCKKIF